MCTKLEKFDDCTIDCDSDATMNFLGVPPLIPATSYDDLLHHHQFWLYLLCVVIAWVGLAITVTMSDTICFQLLGECFYNLIYFFY